MRGRASFAAFASIGVVAAVGIWLPAGLTLLQAWPALTRVLALRSLGFYLLVPYSAVPRLYASCAVPPIDDEG